MIWTVKVLRSYDIMHVHCRYMKHAYSNFGCGGRIGFGFMCRDVRGR